MAQPTHVTICYRRQVQPAQYEAEEVKLEGAFAVEEGEDFEAVAYDMVARARVQAHRVLGRPEPAVEPFSPAFGEQVEVHTGPLKAEQPVEKPKRKRRTKAEMEAARAAEAGENAPGAKAPAEDFDITAEPAKKQGAGDNGPGVDFVIDEPKEITTQELQAAASKAAARLGGPQKIKDLLAEFGIARLSETPADKRQAFLDRLADL